MRLRHLVGVAAQAVRAERGRVREALVAPLASQRLVARVRVHVHLHNTYSADLLNQYIIIIYIEINCCLLLLLKLKNSWPDSANLR